MAKVIKFNRGGNNGTAKCCYCGKVTWKDRIENGLCEMCYEEAGTENEHMDYGHSVLVDGCSECGTDRVEERRRANNFTYNPGKVAAR